MMSDLGHSGLVQLMISCLSQGFHACCHVLAKYDHPRSFHGSLAAVAWVLPRVPTQCHIGCPVQPGQRLRWDQRPPASGCP